MDKETAPEEEGTAAADKAARAGAKEALLAAGGLLLMLAIIKPMRGFASFAPDLVFTAAAGFQLYVPLWLIQRGGEDPKDYGIHAHGLLLGPVAAWRRRRVARRRSTALAKRERRSDVDDTLAAYGRGAALDPVGLAKDTAFAVGLMLITFPPFAVGHHFWLSILSGREARYSFDLPDNLVTIVLTNLLLVALSEELFYRGFLETRLDRVWKDRFHILGLPLTRTVFVASALFAFGHFAGEWGNPARLAPFFPAFVFSFLSRKGRSIFGAVLFHGCSNIYSAILLSGYAHA